MREHLECILILVAAVASWVVEDARSRRLEARTEAAFWRETAAEYRLENDRLREQLREKATRRRA